MDLNKIKILTFANEKFSDSRRRLLNYLSSIGLNNQITLDETYFSDSFKEEYKNILSKERGFGYWLWKPYIILEELKKIESDEILIYLDSSDRPEKTFFDIVINNMKKNDSFFINRGYKNGEWTKRDCFHYMNCDTDFYHNSVQLEAGIICLKNTDSNIELLNEWFSYCKDEQILTDLPNKSGLNNLPNFKDHRHDQSILTNIILKKGINSYRFNHDILKFNFYQDNTTFIFENRNEMISTFDKNMKIAELGVFEGDFSKDIYKICNPSELYLVDLFQGYFGSGDKDGRNHHYVQLELEYEKLKTLYSSDSRVKVIKNSTLEFLDSLPDDYLDMVYIDADHDYLPVKKDLYASLKKVKKGGLICGHDYVRNTQAERAVNEFCNETNLRIKFLTKDGCPSFCIIKK